MLLAEGGWEETSTAEMEKYNRKLNHSINSGTKSSSAELWTCTRLLTSPLGASFSSDPLGGGEGNAQM